MDKIGCAVIGVFGITILLLLFEIITWVARGITWTKWALG